MKKIYEILKVMQYNGLRFPGELIELTEEEAKSLPVQVYESTPVVEAADLNLENLETADAKPVRKGRENANPTRKHKV